MKLYIRIFMLFILMVNCIIKANRNDRRKRVSIGKNLLLIKAEY